MERGSVGQAFLPAIGDVRRQECPRHTGGLFDPIVPVDTCRHLSIPVGSYRSSSSAGSAGGLDDEEAPRSPPGRVVPLS